MASPAHLIAASSLRLENPPSAKVASTSVAHMATKTQEHTRLRNTGTAAMDACGFSCHSVNHSRSLAVILANVMLSYPESGGKRIFPVWMIHDPRAKRKKTRMKVRGTQRWRGTSRSAAATAE